MVSKRYKDFVIDEHLNGNLIVKKKVHSGIYLIGFVTNLEDANALIVEYENLGAPSKHLSEDVLAQMSRKKTEQINNAGSAYSWVPVTPRSLPPAIRSGISAEVLITARLKGEVENTVVKIDKYDAHAKGWEDHDSETWDVVAWAPLVSYRPNVKALPQAGRE